MTAAASSPAPAESAGMSALEKARQQQALLNAKWLEDMADSDGEVRFDALSERLTCHRMLPRKERA